MTDIIKQMTTDCPREDCAIVGDMGGVCTGDASSFGWQCRSCGRSWIVTTYESGPAVFGKDGVAKYQAQRPQTVIETTKNR